MRTKSTNVFSAALQGFLGDYLPGLRGVSSHTILSYRDSLKLFLQFLSKEKKKHASDIDIKDVGAEEAIAFLKYLEMSLGNCIGTRNIRLSAIHSFFRYLSGIYPEYLNTCQRILAIPFKRTYTRTIDYLQAEEITAVFQSVNRLKSAGRRDYALLSFMFNTGARVQEAVDLQAKDLQLTKPFSVNIYGKGRKQRVCPLWPQTAHVIKEYLEEQRIDLREPTAVFTNHLGTPLTRFGVRYIFSKYLLAAANSQPSLKKKRLHPHSMRHSTAICLLEAGIDIITIGHWMGHCSINTTNKYVAIDLEMKRKAIEKIKLLDAKSNKQVSWRKNPDILKWLESL